MVLLPAGLVLGRALLNAIQNRGGQQAAIHMAARTSAIVDGNEYERRGRERQRMIKSRNHINSQYNPYTKQEIRNRLGGTSVRMIHTKAAEKDAIALKEALENEQWIPVYRFNGIRFGVLLARAKLVQTIASVLYLPYSTYGFLIGTNDKEAFIATLVIAIAAPLLLILFSRYLNRLIGVISMNESNEYARIGYLTFWGSRKNQYVEIEDLIPLTETYTEKDQVVKLQWYSSGSNYLFLSTRNCEIVDEERANILFGDVNLFHPYKTL